MNKNIKTTSYSATFGDLYHLMITRPIHDILDNQYGLTVLPAEHKASPFTALLKETKRRLILDGDGKDHQCFDNDFYEWGRSFSPFRRAAKAMVKFTRDGNPQRAAAAARRLIPFRGQFLARRLAIPAVQQIDDLLTHVAGH